ncbi:MAG: Sel1 protein, partial [Leptospirillum sp. Group IV 'UBA BS']
MIVKQGRKSVFRTPVFVRTAASGALWVLSILGLLLVQAGGAKASQDPSLGDLARKASEGDTGAMVRLGLRYDFGQKGASRNLAKAVSWYRTAARKGDPAAMMLLSQRYEIGRGVPRTIAA